MIRRGAMIGLNDFRECEALSGSLRKRPEGVLSDVGRLLRDTHSKPRRRPRGAAPGAAWIVGAGEVEVLRVPLCHCVPAVWERGPETTLPRCAGQSLVSFHFSVPGLLFGGAL